MATQAELDAAGDAVGWNVDNADVDVVLRGYKNKTLAELRADLEKLNAVFEANGARGVALADELDALRIAIAVRRIREEHG